MTLRDTRNNKRRYRKLEKKKTMKNKETTRKNRYGQENKKSEAK
jgi:hypothetical protein